MDEGFPKVMESADEVVDARGRPCPWPILELSTRVRGLSPGRRVLLLATDPAAAADVRAFCEATGNVLVQIEQNAKLVRALIEVGGAQRGPRT